MDEQRINEEEIEAIVCEDEFFEKKMASETSKRKSSNGSRVTEDIFTKAEVLGDGSCLFWAVAMAYLFPVRYNQSLFSERFVKLFSVKSASKIPRVQKLLQNSSLEGAYEDHVLVELVTIVFRNRVVDQMLCRLDELYQCVTLEDFLHSKYEAFIVDGAFRERYQIQFPSQTYLIDLYRLKPNRLNEKSIELMNKELDKISDKEKVQKFKFYCYAESMRNQKSWAGELEIRAIESLLQCQINLFHQNNNTFLIDSNAINICLINKNELHFEFGLVKSEIAIDYFKNANYEMALSLVKFGVDRVNYQDITGWTVLHHAVTTDNYKNIINELVSQGAELNLKNNDNQTPLDLAISLEKDQSKLALTSETQLINKPIDNLNAVNCNPSVSNGFNQFTCNQKTLHLAVFSNDIDSVRHLLAINEVNVNEAMLISVEEGQVDAIKEVFNGESPLHYAARKGYLDLIKVLVVNGKAEVNVHDSFGNTPLLKAIEFGHLKVVKYLVEKGADMNSKDQLSPLSRSAALGHDPIVNYLIEVGAEIEAVDGSGRSALHHAARCAQWNSVECLVEHGAVLDILDHNNQTPIAIVIKKGNWNIVRYLLEKGASLISLSDEIKNDIFKYFITKSDVEKQLFQAIKLGNVEILSTVIKRHADKNNEILSIILAKAYDDFKFFNVPLNQNICVFIENQLLDFRFYSNNKIAIKQNNEEKVNLDNVKDRINLIIGCIDQLNTLQSNDKVSDTFLFNIEFIAQNFQILKRQLSSTFDVLPWEEMQFCLFTFLSFHVYPKNVENVNKLIMHKQRLLSHLKTFRTKLEFLETNVSVKDLKVKKKIDREIAVQSILNLTPEFNKLFKDFAILKDVYSLNRILKHIRIACSIDLKVKPLIGQLAIERAMQVIGECLKNTMISPNMSDSVQNMLITNAPFHVSNILTSLRDSLSHAASSTEIEKHGEQGFYHNVQDDLKKLEIDIPLIAYYRKMHAVKIFFEQIMECKNMEQVRTVASGIADHETVTIAISAKLNDNIYKIKKLITDLDDYMVNKTAIQIKYFEGVYKIFTKYETKLKQIQDESASRLKLLSEFVFTIKKSKDLSFIKNQCRLLSFDLFLDTISDSVYEELLTRTIKISSSFPERDNKIDSMLYKIMTTIEFEGQRIKSINTLKLNFENEKVVTNNDNILAKIDRKISNFIKELPDAKTRANFEEEYERKKDIYRAKTTLIEFYERQSSTEINNENYFIKLIKMINFKVNENETYLSLYAEKDKEKCKKITKRIKGKTDSFEKLINKIKNRPTLSTQTVIMDFVKSLSASKNQVLNFIDIERKVLYDNNFENVKSKNSDSNNYFRILQNIEDILGIGKSDIDLLNLLRENDDIRVAIEMLMLTLMEILENVNLLETNRLFLDEPAPILIGKNLRNYLAHGDLLMDVLSIDHLKSIISHYRILKVNNDQHKSNVYTGSNLIGKVISEDISLLKANYQHKLELIKKHDEMLVNVTKGDASAVTNLDVNCMHIHFKKSKLLTLLHVAAYADNVELLKFLLDNHHFNIYQKYKDGYSIMHCLPKFGSKNVLRFLLKKYSFDIDGNLGLGYTLLHLAAGNGRNSMSKILISHGASLDLTDNEGLTPIKIAIEHNHLNVALTLMDAGANIYARNELSETLLHSAARSGNSVEATFLIRCGLSVNDVDSKMWTPLHYACRLGHLKVVEILLENEADVNALTNAGGTPLSIAVGEGHAQTVELLLCNGANVYDMITEINGGTVLHRAAFDGFENIIQILIKFGANMEATTDGNMTALHYAISSGHHKAVRTLLENGANVDNLNDDNLSVLHDAVKLNRTKTIKTLINFMINANKKNKLGCKALYYAAMEGNVEIIKLLLDCKCNINEVSIDGLMPLHIAIRNNRIEAVELLINSGADINARDDAGNTPLSYACLHGHLQIFKMLISNNANISAKNKSNFTPFLYAVSKGHTKLVQKIMADKDGHCQSDLEKSALHLAAANGHDDVVKILLIKGADVNERSSFFESAPLYLAAQQGHESTVKLLLFNNANVNASFNTEFKTALHEAATHGHEHVADALLKHEARVDTLDMNNKTPLHGAAKHGHSQIIPVLCKFKANVNAKDLDQRTPVHWAALCGHSEFIERLHAHGADIYAVDDEGTSAMHVASHNGHLDAVKTLLSLDKQSNSVNQLALDGESPLHLAAKCGHSDVARLLLDNNAGVDNVTSNGRTALHLAALNGHSQIIPVLCKFKANVNAKDLDQRTPVQWAALCGHSEFVERLHSHGADIYAVDEKGLSTMHFASELGHVEVVKMLLSLEKQSILVNQSALEGESPLHLATLSKNTAIVKMLCNAGANVNYKTNAELTALHIALLNHNHGIAGILIENGADVNAMVLERITPLHVAARYGQVESVRLLLQARAHINCKDDTGLTPLHLAAMNINDEEKGGDMALCLAEKERQLDVVKTLLTFHPDVNAKDDHGNTPLHSALQYSRFDVSETLIKNGADVFAKNYHSSVLHQAVENEEVLKLVLAEMKSKSDGDRLRSAINAEDGEGDTPLMWTAESGYLSAAQILLECDEVDVNRQNVEGKTALHWAVQNDHVIVVETLLASGAKVNGKDHSNKSPLQRSVDLGHLNVTKVLLDHGADVFERNHLFSVLHLSVKKVNNLELILEEMKNQLAEDLDRLRVEINARDERRDSPLMWAAETGNFESMKVLLSCDGIDLNAVNLKGRTAVHWATKNGHLEIVNLLINKRADISVKDENGETAFDIARNKMAEDEKYESIAALILSVTEDT